MNSVPKSHKKTVIQKANTPCWPFSLCAKVTYLFKYQWCAIVLRHNNCVVATCIRNLYRWPAQRSDKFLKVNFQNLSPFSFPPPLQGQYTFWIFCFHSVTNYHKRSGKVPRTFPPVAQLVERRAYTSVVLGSSPSGRTNI